MPAFIAVTREVSPAIVRCELTHQARVPIELALARQQHAEYERALTALGCVVQRLPCGEDMPDCVFVEDTAIVLDEVAIIARPGAVSRRAETVAVAAALSACRPIAHLEAPATLDGGDVLVAGRTIFVGLTSRTNSDGLHQVRQLVEPLGYSVSAATVDGCLHLKSAITALSDETLLVNRDWASEDEFTGFRLIDVDPAEPSGANIVRVGDGFLYASAFPRTRARLERHGYRVTTVDASELAKAEGAVTCCSLIVSGVER